MIPLLQRVAYLLAFSAAVGTATAQAAQTGDRVFQEMGQLPGVSKVVDDFVTIVLDDRRIKDFFDGSNIDRLKRVLVVHLCDLSGGPCRYEGDTMGQIHQGMGLNNAHFNALAEDLQQAMINNGVPYSAQYSLLAKLAAMQRDIVTK